MSTSRFTLLFGLGLWLCFMACLACGRTDAGESTAGVVTKERDAGGASASGRGARGSNDAQGSDDAQARWLLDPSAFEPLGPRLPGAWRTRVSEPEQSLSDYQAAAPNRPAPPRSVLYLQPLAPYPDKVVLPGDLPSLQIDEQGFVSFVFSPRPQQLARFLAAFYGLEVEVAAERPLPAEALAPARVHEKHAQYDARALLEVLGPELPADAYSMTVLVARDLVVGSEQEFSFGYGLHHDRLAVVSFARLDPLFVGKPRASDFQARLRARAHKLVAHEVGHTLGIEHCQTHGCVMNGVAHLPELDATPLRLCPLCLAKLDWLVGLDGAARYEALASYYVDAGLEDERRWVMGRLF